MKNDTPHRLDLYLLLNIAVPLCAAGTVYYLMSPDVLFVRRIDALLGTGFHLTNAVSDATAYRLIRNYGLDMAWAYALVFALFFLTGNHTAELNRIFLISVSFSAFLEMLQRTTYVSGTFDLCDIAVEVLAEAGAVLVIKKLCSNLQNKEVL
jgi:hypothetical protein